MTRRALEQTGAESIKLENKPELFKFVRLRQRATSYFETVAAQPPQHEDTSVEASC